MVGYVTPIINFFNQGMLFFFFIPMVPLNWTISSHRFAGWFGLVYASILNLL